jgi:predicted nucleic acid-binding Zn ribbon protein
MADEDILRMKTYCVVDKVEIPAERVKQRAVTCSKKCQEVHARMRKRRVSTKFCRFCNRSSTPSQRRSWTKFKRWEERYPELAYPEVYELVVTKASVPRKDFVRAIMQGRRYLVDLRPEMADLGFGARGLDKPHDPTPELDQVLAILTQYQKDHPAEVPNDDGYDTKGD